MLLVALFCVAVPVLPAAAAAGTYVRVLQVSDTRDGVDVVLSPAGRQGGAGGDETVSTTGYGSVSEYRRISEGDYVTAARTAGGDEPTMVDMVLSARQGESYTIVVLGEGDHRSLTVVTDDLRLPRAGGSTVRVVNALPGDPVDVAGPGGGPLPLGGFGTYTPVAPGTVTFTVRAPGRAQADVPVVVEANAVVTVVLAERDGKVLAEPHVDAASPPSVPPGPVDAGMGGSVTAGAGPGAAAVALATVLACAASATVLLARRDRRRGGSTPP